MTPQPHSDSARDLRAPFDERQQWAEALCDGLDIAALTARLGLPADRAEAVQSFTGDPAGTVWTPERADELAYVWNLTCAEHGVYACLDH